MFLPQFIKHHSTEYEERREDIQHLGSHLRRTSHQSSPTVSAIQNLYIIQMLIQDHHEIGDPLLDIAFSLVGTSFLGGARSAKELLYLALMVRTMLW